MDWTILISIITPCITAVGGWLIGKKKQKNDFLHELQSSIDLLAKENAKLLNENLEFRKEIVELKLKVHKLEIKIEKES
ncbi:MAG: hypothetical protein LBI60_02930 [Bacteroidales bacterium]|jgi:hypothetical protein|nr:hypothetical protein [Bacteroidales bacterium]